MNIDAIESGKQIPDDLNVIIEIPAHSNIKYEIEKDSGAVFVDRFVAMPMFYPANYGFIPHTLADDGDPTDVLVITPQPIAPGSIIRCRPIGILNMEDESGLDEKVLAVPHTKVTTLYDNVQELSDLPELLVAQIKKFFETYKDLENGKWVKVTGWENSKSAKEKIQRHAQQYKK